MLRVRHYQTSVALGQFNFGQAAQTQTPSRLDPLVRIGLNTAGQVLSKTDPAAPETMVLITRIIEAPGWGVAEPSGPAKVSDLNPVLKAIAFVREHPLITAMLVASVPTVAYLLGKRAG